MLLFPTYLKIFSRKNKQTKKNVCDLVLLMTEAEVSENHQFGNHTSNNFFVASIIIGNNLKTFYINEIRK